MTMISRVLGFVRDMVIARIFGAVAGTDAFFVAFKIPSFLRRLFAEGAFSQAFVPVLSEYKESGQATELRELVDRVAGTLGGVLVLVSVVGMLAAPLLVSVFAPGFLKDPLKFHLAAEMLRVTFPYILFISLTAFAGGILNSYGRFGVPAFTPVMLNLSLIGTALWLAPHMRQPITALAWGVFIAGVVQLAFQAPFLARLGLLPRPRWGWRTEGVQRILKLMLPAIFGSSVAQINLLVDTLVASFLITGSVTWLYYSDRLMEFPLGVFGIALSTVILPSLSKTHARADGPQFARTLDWALRWVLLIGVPAALGLLLLAGPLLTTLFRYDQFGSHDVRMASLSLMTFAVGLPGFMLVKVLAPGFYARQDTRTPVRIGVVAMLSNSVMNVLFVIAFHYADLPGAHAGLALATSLSAFLNGGLLFRALRRNGVLQLQPGWRRLLLQVALAALAMSALLVFAAGDMDAWFARGGWARVLHLLLLVAGGAGSYLAALWLTGVRLQALRGH